MDRAGVAREKYEETCGSPAGHIYRVQSHSMVICLQAGHVRMYLYVKEYLCPFLEHAPTPSRTLHTQYVIGGVSMMVWRKLFPIDILRFFKYQ